MRHFMSSFAVAVFVAITPVVAADAVPAYVAAAVADKARPKDDTDRDADRHPAEIITLAGVKPGDSVVDVGPGRTGYYTKIMSRIVGATGKVIMFNPTWVADKFPVAKEGPAILAKAGYANVEGSIQPMAEIKFETPVDVIFMSQLYHDQIWQKVDVAQMNKAIFDALKPGGVFFIIDHVGPGVTTVEQIDKSHRVEPALVKQQVLSAGFKLEAESDLLKNPADPHTANVFDPSIRGKTDQFVFKFVKPK
ncbi:MAG: class I SAM-dependent methyltransferase [Alphaproteobacteria bacterium]|nr:class I SAM-dependent methyltransferase [Alphaproteobacteria bacterium]